MATTTLSEVLREIDRKLTDDEILMAQRMVEADVELEQILEKLRERIPDIPDDQVPVRRYEVIGNREVREITDAEQALAEMEEMDGDDG